MSEINGRLSTALADRYRLEREIGQGGMATVYLAEDLKHKRKVAVKVLRPELAAVLGAERFVQEITTTASLQHPHILPLFDSGKAAGREGGTEFLYYVMPYVEGETLRQKLDRETQLGIEEAVSITTAIADALDYAHRQGVIHRDIKPENILLHDGRPMVADFGIALAVSAAAGGRMTETGLSLGTPHYMSPEQATAEKDLTNRSDIYSLGAVLYEMLTGNPPHVGASAQQIIMKIVTEEPQPVTNVRKSVPANVAAAVAKALEKLPADRFENATEFAEVLEGRRPIAASTGGTSFVAAPRRSIVPIVIGSAGGGALLTAVVLSLVSRAPVVPVEYWTIEAPRVVDTIPIDNVLDISRDGSKLVYVVADSIGRQALEVRPLDRNAGTLIPGTANARFPRFSPDGQEVAFIAPPGALKSVRVDGGTPQTLAEADVRVGLCWGEDGYIYFSRRSSDSLAGGLSVVPERGGQPAVLTTADPSRGEDGHSCLQALPERRGLLYLSVRAGGIDTGELEAYLFETGQTHKLLQAPFGQVAPTGHLLYVTLDRTLTAVPFDEKTLTITGPPVNLAANIFRNFDNTSFVLGRTGTLLYAEQESQLGRMTWVDRAGETTEVGDGTPQGFDGGFALSPDGRRIFADIARDGVQELWLYTLPVGPWTRFFSAVPEAGARGSRPAWSPDGRTVSYIAPGANGLLTAWSASADGQTAPREIRRVTSIPVQDGEFSRDGQWFVFRQGPVGPTQRDIFYSRPDPDSAAYPLAVTDADEFAPTLSPDGRWLAYVAGGAGQEEIIVQPFPGQGPRTRVSLAGGFGPRWAHSGRELFYRDRAGDLVAAEIRTAAGLSIGARRVLFSAARFQNDRNAALYEVAPDDQRFLFIEPLSGGEVRWKLVRGFSSELESKMGR